MRILCTGSNGFIGTHLCRALKQQEGVTVFGLDLSKPGVMWPYHYFNKQNILDYKGLEFVFDHVRPHIVYHLAAKLGVQDVMDKPGETVSENVLGTLHVANLSKYYGAHLIFASTSDVYGQSTDLPFTEDGHCSIGPSVEPRWSYAISKLAGEHLTLANGGTVVRFFNVTGPGQAPKYVVPIMVQQALAGKPITVLGDGTATRCFADVRDVVQALLGFVDCPVPDMGKQIYNIGADKEISMLELAEVIRQYVNPQAAIEFKPYPNNYTEMARRVPALDKVKALLGWEPKIELKQTVKDVAKCL